MTPSPSSSASPEERSELVRALSIAAWLAYVSWLMFLFRQVGRTLQVSEQAFGGIWEQRIEVMSFTVLPPNALILVPAAALAVAATWLAGTEQTLDLAVQLRLVGWSAVLQGAIAVISVLSIIVNETGSPTEAQDIAMRVSGLAICAAIVILTRTVERLRPGKMPEPDAPDWS